MGGSKVYQRHSYNNGGVLTWTTWGEQRLNKSEQDYLLSLKLDASAYNDRWKGLHVSLAALQTAHPTANAGDYANVDAGIGSAPDIYSWDATDSLWVKTSSSGSGATNTDALPEGTTNLYFTAVRAVSSLLTGFVAGAGTVSATDSILQAIQKIVGNLAGKQDTLVSGTTIKTVNSTSVLGTGNIAVGDSLTSEGALINSATAKSTPVDNDMLGLMDSAASNVLKKISWTNAKASLKSYFDTLYTSSAHIVTKGYIAGGGNGNSSNYSSIEKILFQTDTVSTLAATLAVDRYGLAGANSDTKGYFGGGFSTGYSYEIDAIVFATETAHNPSATTTNTTYDLYGVSSSSAGYFCGGSNSTEIVGITFSSEAAINPAATLTCNDAGLAAVQSNAYAYFAKNTLRDKFTFSTETISAISFSLGFRNSYTGISSATKGYFCGGVYYTASNSIDGIEFATETAIDPAATIYSSYDLASCSSSLAGYCCGGNDSGAINYLTKFTFETETSYLAGAVFSAVRTMAAGVQG